MASSWAHAMAAVTVVAAFAPRATASVAWMAAGVSAVALDIDAVGRLWTGGGDVMWLGGHRALTHSLAFAAGIGVVIMLGLWRATPGAARRLGLWLVVTVAIATHGGLDALTGYGEGIQFLAPWSSERYSAPVRLLGRGIVRDSIAFVVLFLACRTVIRWRGLELPILLDPPFLRPETSRGRQR